MPSHKPAGSVAFVFDPQDFGGVVLSNLAVYLAKYSPGGNLIWATNFGPTTVRDIITVTDLQLDSEGNAYVGYTYNLFVTVVYYTLIKRGSNGNDVWSVVGSANSNGRVRVGGISETNGFFNFYVNQGSMYWTASLSMFDRNGTTTLLASWQDFDNSNSAYRASRTIRNTLAEISNIEGGPLTKRTASGSLLSSIATGYHWTVGSDPWNGVHVAAKGGQLARYDYDGNKTWEMDMAAPCDFMVVDAQGNRFIGLVDGSISRLAGELLVAPVITHAPQPQTIL